MILLHPCVKAGSCRSLPPVLIPRHRVVCPARKAIVCPPWAAKNASLVVLYSGLAIRTRISRYFSAKLPTPTPHTIRPPSLTPWTKFSEYLSHIILHSLRDLLRLTHISYNFLGLTSLSSFHLLRSARPPVVAFFSNGPRIDVRYCDCWPTRVERGRCQWERAELQPLKHPTHKSYSPACECDP